MSQQASSGNIRATPLYGGRSETGVCTLLELGGYRLLFDCGISLPIDYDYLEKLTADLVKAGGVDAILLSHADLQHVGALPILFGKGGLSNTPVICTLPVHKYSHLTLYDFVLNQEMEGEGVESKRYNLDDVDNAFKRVVDLKYCQKYTLPESTRASEAENVVKHQISVTALPAGRTLGGSIWRIRCGPAEVLYTMDINLRKELLLDAVPKDLLPSSPSLMICDASAGSRTTSKKKKEKDEIPSFINAILETVRNGGNVLIPVETAGRLLEVLLILHKHWVENKLGLYHLVLLSHMSNNILEFARCQLEWMGDSLTSGFYNGKANPFDLNMLRCFHDIKTMERRCPGPKVVLATDLSLSYGLSKELLLKWGGDRRCRVIFLDGDLPEKEANNSNNTNIFRTLANELKKLSSSPPIITTINIPVKVPMSGQELENYRLEQEKRKLFLEDEILRKRRQEELNKFKIVQQSDVTDEEEIDEEDKVALKSGESSEYSNKRQKIDYLGSFFDANFKTFESKIIPFTIDDFGLSNNDLTFQDITPSDQRWSAAQAAAAAAAGTKKDGKNSGKTGNNEENDEDDENNMNEENGNNNSTEEDNEQLEKELFRLNQLMNEIPSKLIATKQLIQFTCDFKIFNLTGKLNFKSMKDFILHISPQRLLLMCGNEKDFDSFTSFMKQSLPKCELFQPANRRSSIFSIFTESFKLQISRQLIPLRMQKITSILNNLSLNNNSDGSSNNNNNNSSNPGGGAGGDGSAGTGGGGDGYCTVALLKGNISTAENITVDGHRLIRYLGEGKGNQLMSLSSIPFLSSLPVMTPSLPELPENNEEEGEQGGGEEEGDGDATEGQEEEGYDEQQEAAYEEGGGVEDDQMEVDQSYDQAEGGGEGEDQQQHTLDGPAEPPRRKIIIENSKELRQKQTEELLQARRAKAQEFFQNLPIAPKDETIGVISFGEVTLTQLKQQLDAIGLKTDYRVNASGGALVCNDQVIISKDTDNNFHIEGPPGKTYFEVRRIVYKQFAFV